MKIGIAGAGAIGGFLGASLARSGQADICALARGATLGALRKHGWRLEKGGDRIEAPVFASDEPSKLGKQDLLIITVKGTSLPELAPHLRPMIGPETVILPAMNGIPWWFCRVDGPFEPFAIRSVDPEGRIAGSLPAAQTLGCVVHIGASCPEPGVVKHAQGNELIIGDAIGGISERTQRIASMLARADIGIRLSDSIRNDIWFKLWGNLTMNPVSALTGATLDRLLNDPLVTEFCSSAMREAAAIGTKIGCPVNQEPEDRHAITRRLGAFKTSMLQDVEAGKTIELDSIVGAAQEIGRHFNMSTPNIDALLGLTRLFARTRGLYPEPEAA